MKTQDRSSPPLDEWAPRQNNVNIDSGDASIVELGASANSIQLQVGQSNNTDSWQNSTKTEPPSPQNNPISISPHQPHTNSHPLSPISNPIPSYHPSTLYLTNQNAYPSLNNHLFDPYLPPPYSHSLNPHAHLYPTVQNTSFQHHL